MKNFLFCLLLAFGSGVHAYAVPDVPNTIPPLQADSTDLRAYAGTYEFASGSPIGQFVIKLEKGDLYGEADSYGANKLLKQPEPDTFKSTSQYGSVLTFTRDANTKAITGFKMAIQGQELVAKKK
jgi:hypothetical protein